MQESCEQLPSGLYQFSAYAITARAFPGFSLLMEALISDSRMGLSASSLGGDTLKVFVEIFLLQWLFPEQLFTVHKHLITSSVIGEVSICILDRFDVRFPLLIDLPGQFVCFASLLFL